MHENKLWIANNKLKIYNNIVLRQTFIVARNDGPIMAQMSYIWIRRPVISFIVTKPNICAGHEISASI